MPGSPMPQRSNQVPDQIESRLEFETLISDTSATIFKTPPEQVEIAVERALARVREFFQADRCALLSASADGRLVNVRLAAYAEGVPPVSRELNLAKLFPWMWRELRAKRAPVRISRRAELPPEAASELPAWDQMGVRSALVLPIETGPEVRHLVVIQTVHRERDWPDALVLRLRVLAGLLVQALERNELLTYLREAEARQRAGAELAGLAFYEVDFGRGVAYADDRLIEVCGVPPERRQGLQVLEHWLEHLHPDDRPRVLDLREQLHDGRRDKFSLEYRYLHPSIGERWLHHLAGTSQRDHAGRAVVTYGVIRDIT